MDFGKVAATKLNSTDFTLPKEPAANKAILEAGKNKVTKNGQLAYVGCAKWGRKEWIGKIYPKGVKEKDFLSHYVHHYNSIELNATHYRIFPASTIAGWSKQAEGLDFKFCPKVPNSISHFGTLEDKQIQTDKFLESISAFDNHLGPIFLQVSDRFAPNRSGELFKYLGSLPKDVQFFLEVRHPDWFEDKAARKDLFDALRSLHTGAIITDAAGRRDCCHMELTIPKAFIRFVGNSLHPTDYKRCDDWVNRIQYWLENGLQELYFFMHMHDEATSPELTVYLVEQLNKKCGLDLKKPRFEENDKVSATGKK